MTKRSDLKKRIRERQTKTGETYATARRHILNAGGLRCPDCGGPIETRIVEKMAELTGDETEGQEADHYAAMMSGDWGEWAVEVEEEYCPKCETPIQRMMLRAIGRTPALLLKDDKGDFEQLTLELDKEESTWGSNAWRVHGVTPKGKRYVSSIFPINSRMAPEEIRRMQKRAAADGLAEIRTKLRRRK